MRKLLLITVTAGLLCLASRSEFSSARTDTTDIVESIERVKLRDSGLRSPPVQPPRYPVYVMRDARGVWSEREKLEWDDPRGGAIYSTGSSQYLVLKNGDLLIPVCFRISKPLMRTGRPVPPGPVFVPVSVL